MTSPFTVGSKWNITRSGAGTDEIEVTTATATQFTAKYIGAQSANPSVFTGEVEERQGQVIALKQDGAPTHYFSFLIGVRQTGGGPIQYNGNWCDVAGTLGSAVLTLVG